MSLTGETATAVCNLMDAQMTSEEFDAAVARNKLLHDCKTKGFKHLQKLGPLDGGVGLKKKPDVIRMNGYDFARVGAKLINEGQTTKAEWARKCGRNAGDLRYYCDKYGIELVRKLNQPIDHEKVYIKARQMINRDGRRMKDTAYRCGVSTTFLRNLFQSKGRAYNATTIKVEKVKS